MTTHRGSKDRDYISDAIKLACTSYMGIICSSYYCPLVKKILLWIIKKRHSITFDASLFITFSFDHLCYDCLHRINKSFSNNPNDPLIFRSFYTYIKVILIFEYIKWWRFNRHTYGITPNENIYISHIRLFNVNISKQIRIIFSIWLQNCN